MCDGISDNPWYGLSLGRWPWRSTVSMWFSVLPNRCSQFGPERRQLGPILLGHFNALAQAE